MFEDHFNDNHNDWYLGEYSWQEGNITASIIDGKYKIEHFPITENHAFIIKVPISQPLKDFYFSVELLMPKDSPVDTYTNIKFVTSKDRETAYFLSISENLFSCDMRESSGYKTLSQNYDINLNGLSNQVSILTSGSNTQIFMNGELACTGENTQYNVSSDQSGDIYIGGSTTSKLNFTTEFDNLFIRTPPPAPCPNGAPSGNFKLIINNTNDSPITIQIDGEDQDIQPGENVLYLIAVDPNNRPKSHSLYYDKTFEIVVVDECGEMLITIPK